MVRETFLPFMFGYKGELFSTFIFALSAAGSCASITLDAERPYAYRDHGATGDLRFGQAGTGPLDPSKVPSWS